jgi:sec-independent protein translocase protein TatA
LNSEPGTDQFRLKEKSGEERNNLAIGGIMFGIGMPELLIIMVIILIIFGAGKLPEIGAGMGKAIRNFKGATSEIEPKYPEKTEGKEIS